MRDVNNILYPIALILCILVQNAVNAQNITFDSEVWDMGTIAEDGGKVSHTFTMYNNTESPVVILSTSSSCGCTTSSYPSYPIMMGDSAKVVVTYDPMNRPYDFLSTVRLLTTESELPLKLSLKGDVTPRKRSVEELYPFEMGSGLRFSANYFPLSYIEQGIPRAGSISYINDSRRAITLELREKMGSGIFTIDYPRKIEAAAEGVINFSYFTEASDGRYGEVKDSFELYINGKLSRYPFTAMGHVTEHFTDYMRENSPRASFAQRTIRLDKISSDEAVTVETYIENSGVETLIIRNIDSDDSINCSIKVGEEIKAGDNKQIFIIFTPKEGEYGAFTKYITFTTNDTEQPMQRIRLNGVVEK